MLSMPFSYRALLTRLVSPQLEQLRETRQIEKEAGKRYCLFSKGYHRNYYGQEGRDNGEIETRPHTQSKSFLDKFIVSMKTSNPTPKKQEESSLCKYTAVDEHLEKNQPFGYSFCRDDIS